FREKCKINLGTDVRRLCRPSKRHRGRLLPYNEADTSRSDGARTKTSRGSGAPADTDRGDGGLAPKPNSALDQARPSARLLSSQPTPLTSFWFSSSDTSRPDAADIPRCIGIVLLRADPIFA